MQLKQSRNGTKNIQKSQFVISWLLLRLGVPSPASTCIRAQLCHNFEELRIFDLKELGLKCSRWLPRCYIFDHMIVVTITNVLCYCRYMLICPVPSSCYHALNRSCVELREVCISGLSVICRYSMIYMCVCEPSEQI